MSGQWWENDLIVGPFADIPAANAWAAANPSSLFPGLLATAGGVQYRWGGNAWARIPATWTWGGYTDDMIYVSVGAGKDFPDIQSAINSIVDASIKKQYVIDVYDDFIYTDIRDLYYKSTGLHPATQNVTEYVAAFTTRDFIHIRGIGGRKKVSVLSPTTLAAGAYQYIQVGITCGNFRIENIDTLIRGGRYAMHGDEGRNVPQIDTNATQYFANGIYEHLGNATSDGYPVGAWTVCCAQANGTASGQRQDFENIEWKAPVPNPFYFHGNVGFSRSSQHRFKNCKITPTKKIKISDMTSGYTELGSGMPCQIEIDGCDFPYFHLMNNIYSDETARGNMNYINAGTAVMIGASNAKRYCKEFDRRGLFLKVTAVNTDISVDGGTAYEAIWGKTDLKWAPAVDASAYVFAAVRLENPNLAIGSSQIYSLPYRLGNCAATPKTLLVTIGGTQRTITFSQNYMTSDGSPYTPTTVPAIGEQAIIDEIVSQGLGLVCGYNYSGVYLSAYPDVEVTGFNSSTATILRGAAVVRDYSQGGNCIKLCGAGETPIGIASTRIDIGKAGKFIKLDSSLFPAAYVSGVGTPAAGAMFTTAASGAFAATADPSLAKIVAIDAGTVAAYPGY